MILTNPLYQFDQNGTKSLVNWAESKIKTAVSPFAVAQNLVTRLGGHFHNGRSTFGFWVPELADMDLPEDRVFLELLRPQQPIDLQADKQTLRFWRTRLPVFLSGEFAWGVYTGVNAGNREQIGDFYWLVYEDDNGRFHPIRDPLAHSVPFGVLAPAELYDLEQMTAARADKAHFSRLDTQPDPDGTPRVQPPVNILQIHVNTASASGTLAGLTDIYQTIAAKIESSQSLNPDEHVYIGYDAVQLMPIEPLIEHEAGPLFWEPGNVETLRTLEKFSMTKWLVCGMNRGMKTYKNISNPYWKNFMTSVLLAR